MHSIYTLAPGWLGLILYACILTLLQPQHACPTPTPNQWAGLSQPPISQPATEAPTLLPQSGSGIHTPRSPGSSCSNNSSSSSSSRGRLCTYTWLARLETRFGLKSGLRSAGSIPYWDTASGRVWQILSVIREHLRPLIETPPSPQKSCTSHVLTGCVCAKERLFYTHRCDGPAEEPVDTWYIPRR